MVNWAILALQDLTKGQLSDELLQHQPPSSTDSTRLGSRVGDRLRDSLMSSPPPMDRPRSDAASWRLQGLESGRTPVLLSKKNQNNHSGPAPLRGDIYPAQVELIALPQPGSKPIPMTSLSATAKRYLNCSESMLATEDEMKANLLEANVPEEPYTDPNLNNKSSLLKLAVRMALAGMLRTAKRRKGTVGLFTVVKKVGPDGTLVLRLIFDQRKDNAAWKRPPWTGLASPSSLASIDLSHLQGDWEIVVASGDLPNYYYTLEIPVWASEYFCLPLITAIELKNELARQGQHQAAEELGSDELVALAVPPMGWSWAVFLAESVLDDLVEDPKNPSSALWRRDKRIIEAGVLPQMTIDNPLTYTYIDDFGAIGVKTQHKNLPLEMKNTTTAYIRSCGLEVHKECVSIQEKIIGVEVGGCVPFVRPPEEKKWVLRESLFATSRKKKVRPNLVETMVATYNWMALINRPMLSIFQDTYRWVREHRHLKTEIDLPLEVRKEMAVAAYLLPFIGQCLTAKWNLTVMEVDASYEGGAIITTQSTEEEIREEAKWATRGNYAAQTEVQQWDPSKQFAPPTQQLPKQLKPKAVRTYRFLHLFSGHRHAQDLEFFLRVGGARRGWLVIVKSVDLAYGNECNLALDEVVGQLREEAIYGLYDGMHTGPPCSTWSAVRWRPGGPPPLRSRDYPWGLPDLSHGLIKTVALHNILMKNSCSVLETMAEKGATVTMEHPEDRKRVPFASIWATSFFLRLARRAGILLRSFPQCAFGAPSKKMTTIAYAGVNADRFLVQCTHQSHSEILFGLDEQGNFRTRKAQTYPPQMNEALAETHLDGWKDREPFMQEERAAAVILESELKRQPDLGQRSPVPEVGPGWDPISRWKLLAQWEWQFWEHNNILELKTAAIAAERFSRDYNCWDRRSLIISDSQATIGALTKGRSSVPSFNKVCRRVCALVIGTGIKFYYRYVRTHRNVADGPSRQQPLGYAGQTPVVPDSHTGAWSELPDVFYIKTKG